MFTVVETLALRAARYRRSAVGYVEMSFKKNLFVQEKNLFFLPFWVEQSPQPTTHTGGRFLSHRDARLIIAPCN